MNCPDCQSKKTSVRKTLHVGSVVSRHRACSSCGIEWSTEEVVRHIHRKPGSGSGNGSGSAPLQRDAADTGDQGRPPVATGEKEQRDASATGDHRWPRVITGGQTETEDPAETEKSPVATGDQGRPPVAENSSSAQYVSVLSTEKRDREDPDPDPYCAELESFPVVGKGGHEWRMTKVLLAELSAAFPDLDAVAECRKARGWLVASRTRRKTPAGMGRFLFGWLGRAQNDGRRSGGKVTNGHSVRVGYMPADAGMKHTEREDEF